MAGCDRQPAAEWDTGYGCVCLCVCVCFCLSVMSVCLSVCLTVYVYVSMHVCMCLFMYLYMNKLIYVCMHACMYACMYYCRHACMYVGMLVICNVHYMYVEICVCLFVSNSLFVRTTELLPPSRSPQRFVREISRNGDIPTRRLS